MRSEIKDFNFLYKEQPEEKIKARKYALTDSEKNLEYTENMNTGREREVVKDLQSSAQKFF